MRRFAFLFVPALIFMSGCSGTQKKEAKLFSAGEKAIVGNLSYSVIDTQIAPSLGSDAATQRTPQNRFVMVQISVSNSGSADAVIPGLTLVDDSGQSYRELADGTGVPRWLGVVRKVGPTQTEAGVLLFDAPAKHFRLRVTDELEDEVSIDVPLNFIHEEMHDLKTSPDPGVIAVPK